MNNSNELYVVYTCDRTEIRSLFDEIVQSLPSLNATVQTETANGKLFHYDETPEIASFSTFIDENVSYALGNNWI